MTKIGTILTGVLFFMWGMGSLTGQSNFRQYIRYQIRVQLDDQGHQLRGDISWEYANNSADTLHELWVHLWPNAYSNRSTAFAQQQLRMRSTKFYYAPDHQLGGIDSLAFRVNGQLLDWQPDPNQPDVTRLPLAQPLLPGGKLTVATPFRLRIPASFSRLGHVGESYQLTQWFPKPAVYDQTGWHPMSYLDAGEFYSDFASFDVFITLPANYVVAATGTLETRTELLAQRQRVADTRQYLDTLTTPRQGLVDELFPPSVSEMKTLHYRADNVHDFAWFADKRFRVLTDTLRLPSGREIEAAVFFTQTEENLWRNALDYVKRSTRFYAQHVGEYPYPQVTAVQSALSAGGGMEYPMITVIDLAGNASSLDEVIAHEVGHNWFYGVLASNERDHAWMDEGLNSYYEGRYMDTYYPDESSYLPSFVTGGDLLSFERASMEVMQSMGADQAPNTTSAMLSPANYWLGAYTKPSFAFKQLEAYVGVQQLDAAMQDYYRNWQFKHPQPAHLRTSLENSLGQDLGWLFEGLLNSNHHIDYTIQQAKVGADSIHLTISNRGQVPAPFPVVVYSANADSSVFWQPGFLGRRSIALPVPGAQRIQIDPARLTLEANRFNNGYTLGRLFPRFDPIQLRLGLGYNHQDKSSLYALPALAWNAYDGAQLGLVLHSGFVPSRPVEWFATPMIGLGSGQVSGITGLRVRVKQAHPKLDGLQLRVSAQMFQWANLPGDNDKHLGYRRLGAGIRQHFATSPAGTLAHYLEASVVLPSTQRARFNPEGGLENTTWENNFVGRLCYQLDNYRVLAPYRLTAAYETQTFTDPFGQTQSYHRLSLTASGELSYHTRRSVQWRFFGGYFPNNTLKGSGFVHPTALSLVDGAYADYAYDELFFGRSEIDGLASQQLGLAAGGFRTPIGPGFQLGRSNHYLLAVNLGADLPFTPRWLPLRPWLDAGYYDEDFRLGAGPTFLWAAGLGFEWLGGRVGLYLPLVGSDSIMDRLAERGGIKSQLAFRFRLTELAPWRLAEETLKIW